MKNLKPILLQTLNAIALALATGIICTLSDFIGTPINNANDIITATLHWSAIILALTLLYYAILTLPKIPAATLTTLIMSAGATLAYYRTTLNYSLNPYMFDILGTNGVEDSVITWLTILWTLTATATALTLVLLGKKHYKTNYRKPHTWAALALSIALLTLILNPQSRLSQPIRNRIPFNIAYTYINHLQNRQQIQTTRQRWFNTATEKQDSIITILVIGESVRADNLGINGYRRQTTPLLATQPNLIPLKHMWTDITYTNGSIPRIMTRATQQNPTPAYTERSLIDIYRAAKQPSHIICNQDIEPQYAYFWAEADSLYIVHNNKNVYNFSKWLDQNTLKPYNHLINQIHEGLIIIHCIGSHWWYGSHYPKNEEHYKPVAKSRIISNCDSIEIVNSYDNTIRYMDKIINQIIKPLKNKKAILIYISDHGEALGENGMWLHASECQAMHRTAAFIWTSDPYKQAKPTFVNRLKQLTDKPLKTDSIYYWATENFNITTTKAQTYY